MGHPDAETTNALAQVVRETPAGSNSLITDLRGTGQFRPKTAGDPEAAGTGLVGNLQERIRVSLADAVQSIFQPLQIIVMVPKRRISPFTLSFSDGDGDGVFVDIQAEVEFNSFHGVVVCSYFT
jgi:hypothetical protein